MKPKLKPLASKPGLLQQLYYCHSVSPEKEAMTEFIGKH